MKRLLWILLLLPGVLHAQLSEREIARSAAMQGQKLLQFYRLLTGNYVDTVNYEAVVEQGVRNMLQQLDPHSSYLTSEEMEQVQQTFDGSFGGIGVEYNVLGDTIIVVNTISGGPAEMLGVRPNDRIVSVDGRSVVGVKRVEVPSLLRGPKGSTVEIEVVRKGSEHPLSFRIVRDKISINTIDAAYKVNPSIGYIKVNRFANNTVPEFADAIASMSPMDALILDLRGNGGGLLDQAIGLSEFFMKKGERIVSTEGNMVEPAVFYARKDGAFDGKLIILMDEVSASGSEIVAGAMQDWDRAIIVGRPSFGKGLVQRQFILVDGSSVRITVARYHTPTGRVIQRPFENGKKDEYYKAHTERFSRDYHDSINANAQEYETLYSSRKVYGGGGIYPDIYVERDTTTYTPYLGQIIMSGTLNEFIVGYLDSTRVYLMSNYPDYKSFRKDFETDDAIMNSLVRLSEKKGIQYDSVQMNTSAPYMKVLIKALVASKLWNMNEYYRSINDSGIDEEYNAAMKCIKIMPTGRVTDQMLKKLHTAVVQ